MKRREYLVASGSIAAMTISGCSSENGNGDGNGDNGDSGDGSEGNNGDSDGETERNQGSLVPPTLESHDVRPMTGGYEVEVTMTNEMESVLNRAVGEVDVYNDNTRIADGRAAIIDLGAGITGSASALLPQLNPGNVTHYTITMTGETEEFEETNTEEHEFDGEEFRNRLSI